MKEYEYIVLDVWDEDELSEGVVLEQIKAGAWTYFESNHRCFDLESAAEEILSKKYVDWEMFEEDDVVFLAIKEVGENKEIEVYSVSVRYIFSTSASMIFDNDDLIQQEEIM